LTTAVIIAVLVVGLALLAWLGWVLLERRARARRPLRHEHVTFAEEDWSTLAPSETPGDVHIVREDD
jgi:HAMP domain-containing protein